MQIMKKIGLIQAAACVLTAFAVGNACAQGGETPSEQASVSTAAPLTPKEMRKANRQLAKLVRRTLVKVKGLDSSSIVVVAKNGDILLGGSVPEASQVGLAVSAAQGVHGVRAVKNGLTIKAQGQ
jgi:hyperosmotically inducible periplasmic protein